MWQVIEAIASAVGIYYNYTGKTECNNLNDSTPSSLAKGWNFQVKTFASIDMLTEILYYTGLHGDGDAYVFTWTHR